MNPVFVSDAFSRFCFLLGILGIVELAYLQTSGMEISFVAIAFACCVIGLITGQAQGREEHSPF